MSRVLNFIWINLDFPSPKTAAALPFQRPMPPQYIDSIINAANHNPDTQIKLWIDSKRLTQEQRLFLQEQLSAGSANAALSDLRDIPAYDREALYNKPETSRFWRDDKKSLIWRQVDAAKVLICLQGNFDQVFFADADLAGFKTSDEALQKKIRTHGIFVNQGPDYPLIENQMWGFDSARRRPFFEALYKDTLKQAYKGENGWMSLVNMVDQMLCASKQSGGEGIYLYDIVHFTRESGLRAHHPDHRFANGLGDVNPAFDIPGGQLSRIFAGLGQKLPQALKNCAEIPQSLLRKLKR
ncbi:MAG: hypothetical protein ACK4PK_01390 [Alphaproteobacteria bacterium]